VSTPTRPVLFLDVDGTLLPFGGDGPRRDLRAREYVDRLDAAVGSRLAALSCDLIWATTWGEQANTELGHRLGLPRLPVVTWPDDTEDRRREDAWFGLHWKTRRLVALSRGRAMVWVDDEHTDADREWVASHHDERALLLRVDAAVGVSVEDVGVIDEWLLSPDAG
jgi:hypothetical protein